MKYKVDEFYDYETFMTFLWLNDNQSRIMCDLCSTDVNCAIIYSEEVLYVQTKLWVL